ncbi:MAG: lytic murein transglycosylase [Quisquiliibacterium sp.]
MALGLPALARAEPGYVDCVRGLRGAALQRGVSAAGFDRLTGGLAPDMSVLERLDYQPEFKLPIWDYMAALVDDERIAEGRAMQVRWRDTLSAIEAKYGVDAATVIALWGVESNFGKSFGKRPLLVSLSTLSCFGRRQEFFRGEFLAALRIVDQGNLPVERLVGSWAGAFGHTQFMPSTFMRVAVDFDGDGRRDIIDSIPDALASSANYLKLAGWRSRQTWGYEVKLPARFDEAQSGRKNTRTLAQWTKLGLRALVPGRSKPGASARAQGMPADAKAGLLLPAGLQGPAFLVFRNFEAIYSYNAAESYALAIAHLADRLRGGGPFVAPWPTDDAGQPRAERRELQAQLRARGHEIGEIDGMIGSRSRAAIKAEEQRLGLEPTGRAGQKVLRLLRKQPG